MPREVKRSVRYLDISPVSKGISKRSENKENVLSASSTQKPIGASSKDPFQYTTVKTEKRKNPKNLCLQSIENTQLTQRSPLPSVGILPNSATQSARFFSGTNFAVFNDYDEDQKITKKRCVDTSKVQSTSIKKHTPFQSVFDKKADISKQNRIPINKYIDDLNVNKKKRLRRSVSMQFISKIQYYENINQNIKKELECPQHKRIVQLRDEASVKNTIETPVGLFNDPPPFVPIKVEHNQIQQKNTSTVPQQISSLSQIKGSQYSDDIIKFYEQQENERKKYLFSVRTVNTLCIKRSTLVYSVIDIVRKLNYPSFITYQAIRIMDDTLDVHIMKSNLLEIMMLASLWVALKKDYVYTKTPSAKKMIEISQCRCTVEELIHLEMEIMKALKFNISYPDPTSILLYNVTTHQNNFSIFEMEIGRIYYMGAYMLDIVLFNEKLMDKSALLIAAVVAELSIVLSFNRLKDIKKDTFEKWYPQYAKNSFPESLHREVRYVILDDIIKSFNNDNNEYIVFEKYSRSRYGRVSKVLLKCFEKI